MRWHYLPVYIENEEGYRDYFLIEIYLDEEGEVDSWTGPGRVMPFGIDVNDMVGGLEMMINDARKYKPVEYKQIKSGYRPELNDGERQ